MPESRYSFDSPTHSFDAELHSVKYVHTISAAGRLLPSSSKWNSVEFDFNLLPQSSTGFDSLPSGFSKNVDFNLVIRDKEYFKRFVIISASLILSIIVLVLVLHFWPHKHKHDSSSNHINLALSQALLFFDAQKSGYYPENGLVKFRGDSGTNDGNTSSVKADLIGGFYDSGNNIKFSFPTAYTITLLSWTVIEYHQKYADIGELDHVKDIVKWGSDYLLKVFVAPNTTSAQATLYSQVGSAGNETENDINCWQRPEDMSYPRPVSVCGSMASDLAGEIVAAYSAASMVLQEDKQYSEKLIKSAEDLFNIGIGVDLKQQGTYTANADCGGEARQFYNSSGYRDELIWGGTWLFFATGNATYLEYATKNFAAAEKEETFSEKGIFYWNNKLTATQVLLTRVRFFRDLGYPYEDAFGASSTRTDLLMCSYLSDLDFIKTQGGLILLKPEHGAPLEYAATASFLSKLYSDYLDLQGRSGSRCGSSSFSLEMLRNFSMSQVNYILGENPMKMSYVVGLGDEYPKQVHHRAASIPWDNHNQRHYSCEEGAQWLQSKQPNPNVLSGAMVGGPAQNDIFLDEREKPVYTAPSIASNAGLVAALVALVDYYSAGAGYDLGIDKMGMFENIHLIS